LFVDTLYNFGKKTLERGKRRPKGASPNERGFLHFYPQTSFLLCSNELCDQGSQLGIKRTAPHSQTFWCK